MRSNALWDVLLATEDEAKILAGSTLTTKRVRLQNEYMGTRQTKITVRWTLVGIGWGLFCLIRPNGWETATISRARIDIGDFVLQFTLTRKGFAEIPNVLMRRENDPCRGRGTSSLLLGVWCYRTHDPKRFPSKTQCYNLVKQQQLKKQESLARLTILKRGRKEWMEVVKPSPARGLTGATTNLREDGSWWIQNGNWALSWTDTGSIIQTDKCERVHLSSQLPTWLATRIEC